jgi:diguanylate cyclase (GGDEF)-like protein
LLACVMRELFVTLNNERNQDPLTRLLNRRAFFEQADRQLQINTGGVWALIACDVDHFKKVNDTWGHAAGDQALALVAATLMQQVRQNDLVARFGGEEFVILLKCQDIQSAKMVADRMCLQIAKTHFPAISGSLTASFGVTLIASSQSLLVAIENADAMLYQAKRAGRNQVAHEMEAVL